MQLRHATLHQLRIFLAVTRHKSFARAAEALHLSPPTLSLQVKQLSTTVGQPLFEQLGKKIFLTEAGQTLADACQDVESRLERLTEDLAALRGIEKGSQKRRATKHDCGQRGKMPVAQPTRKRRQMHRR